jgi:hypothetical protein
MEALGGVRKPFSLEGMTFRLLNHRPHSFCHLAKINSARVWEDFLVGHDTVINAINVLSSSLRVGIDLASGEKKLYHDRTSRYGRLTRPELGW